MAEDSGRRAMTWNMGLFNKIGGKGTIHRVWAQLKENTRVGGRRRSRSSDSCEDLEEAKRLIESLNVSDTCDRISCIELNRSAGTSMEALRLTTDFGEDRSEHWDVEEDTESLHYSASEESVGESIHLDFDGRQAGDISLTQDEEIWYNDAENEDSLLLLPLSPSMQQEREAGVWSDRVETAEEDVEDSCRRFSGMRMLSRTLLEQLLELKNGMLMKENI